jgi:DNA-binding CsgD family transcriptional regulator
VPGDVDRLVGRTQECRRLDDLLEGLRHRRSATLIIEGLPGIGKTALLAYAMARAEDLCVVHAEGVETEAVLPFMTLAGLLVPFAYRLHDLAAPQRVALSAALGLAAADSADRLTVGTATLSCLSLAAEARPVLVVVDDGQWVDPSSAEALTFACRRLAHEGVGVLIALREGEPGPFADSGLATLHVGGLGREDSYRLLGDGTAPDVGARIVASTGGHPLAIIELGRILSERQRDGREPLPDPLPAGEGVERAFARRVAQLSDGGRALLMIAAADAGGEVGVLSTASRRVGIGMEALDEILAARLVDVRENRLFFMHPLLRSVVYQLASEDPRREAHRALAASLRRETDLDRRAWHLSAAAVGPDDCAAGALEHAARSARGRGAFAVAGAALQRAAELSTAEGERARLLVDAGDAFWRGGQSAKAMATLGDALALTADPVRRADIRLKTGVPVALSQSLPSLRDELTQAAHEIRHLDPARAAILLAQASLAALNTGRIRDASAAAGEAVRLSGGNGLAHLAASLALALTHLAEGEQRRAVAELEGFVALIDGVGMRHEWFGVAEYVANGLMWAERFSDAQRLLDAMIGFARDLSAPGLMPFALSVRGELAFWTGNWMNTMSDASYGADLARGSQQTGLLAYPLVTLARVESALGREQEAREHLKAAVELAAFAGNLSVECWAHGAMGFLELGGGRPDAAVTHLEQTARTIDSLDVWHPSSLTWRGDLVEVQARLGRLRPARQSLAHLEDLADRTTGTWAAAAVQRARGMVVDDGFEDHFGEALDALERLSLPFEWARTHLCCGERLRWAGRPSDATAHLWAAREQFARLGATPWLTRADVELAACGEYPARLRPSGVERLTDQELQVAMAVVAGATNREAAAELFLSRRTVEHHLGNVYRKLGIHSRMHLVRLMSTSE